MTNGGRGGGAAGGDGGRLSGLVSILVTQDAGGQGGGAKLKSESQLARRIYAECSQKYVDVC